MSHSFSDSINLWNQTDSQVAFSLFWVINHHHIGSFKIFQADAKISIIIQSTCKQGRKSLIKIYIMLYIDFTYLIYEGDSMPMIRFITLLILLLLLLPSHIRSLEDGKVKPQEKDMLHRNQHTLYKTRWKRKLDKRGLINYTYIISFLFDSNKLQPQEHR